MSAGSLTSFQHPATASAAPSSHVKLQSGETNHSPSACIRNWQAWLLLVFATAAAGPAHADSRDGKWVIVPSVVGDRGDPAHAARKVAEQLEKELARHEGVAFSIDQARERFEQRGSSPPMVAKASDIDALARDAQMALYHVASGLPSRAKRDVERAMGRARHVLESLNREARAARHLLDACLYLVRAHLQHDDREKARRQALECRRLVPDIEPDGTMHPPDVIGVLAEAEARLRNRDPGSLRIESKPTGCGVYVNGRKLGTTPLELPQLSPGEYRVQVECHDGELGRVHHAVIGSHRVVLQVDTRFDATVQTAFDVSLRYPNREQEQRYRDRDAVEVGRIVGASDVLLVWPTDAASPDTGAVQLDRFRVSDGKHLAGVRLPLSPKGLLSHTAATGIRETLRKGHFTGEASKRTETRHAREPDIEDARPEAPEPTPAPPETPEPREELTAEQTQPPSFDTRPRNEEDAAGLEGTVIAGLALGASGVVAQGVSWGLQAHLLGLQSQYADSLNAGGDGSVSLARIESFEAAPLLTQGVGAAALTASLPLWLPEQRDMPWWGWLSGATGLGVAAAGTLLSVQAAQCDEFDRNGRCVESELATNLGPMLLMQSAPLLAVPLVYWIRMATSGMSGEHAAGVRVTPHGAVLQWKGRL